MGINGDPKVQSKWRDAEFKRRQRSAPNERASNTRGIHHVRPIRQAALATTQSSSTTATMPAGCGGFTRWQVIEGMTLSTRSPRVSRTTDQGAIQNERHATSNKSSGLDFIKKATIVEAKK